MKHHTQQNLFDRNTVEKYRDKNLYFATTNKYVCMYILRTISVSIGKVETEHVDNLNTKSRRVTDRYNQISAPLTRKLFYHIFKTSLRTNDYYKLSTDILLNKCNGTAVFLLYHESEFPTWGHLNILYRVGRNGIIVD